MAATTDDISVPEHAGAAGRSAVAHRRWTLVAASLGFAVIQLDVSAVDVAIRPIGASLGGGVGALQWVVNAYTVAFAALILTAGALGDRVGAKRVFAGGFVLFTAASAVCRLVPGLHVALAIAVALCAAAALCALAVRAGGGNPPGEDGR